jgi:anti-sigma factor RsiW
MTASPICAQQDRVLGLLSQPRREWIASSPEDRLWLAAHLRECPACARLAGSAAAAREELHAFASQTVAGRDLVRNTQFQVRLRAAQMRRQQERMVPLWLGVSLAALWTVGSLPMLWQGFESLSQAFAFPAPFWQAAAVLAWLTPTGLFTSFAVSLRREREIQG